METILNNLLKLLKVKQIKEDKEENKFKKPDGYKNINSSQIQMHTH